MRPFPNKDDAIEYLQEDVIGQFIRSTSISDGDHGISLEKHIHGHKVDRSSLGDIVYSDRTFSELKCLLHSNSIHIAKTSIYNSTPTLKEHQEWAFKKMQSTFIVQMRDDTIQESSPLEADYIFTVKGYRVKEIVWLENLDYNKFIEAINIREASSYTKFESSITYNNLIKCYDFGEYLSSYNRKKCA